GDAEPLLMPVVRLDHEQHPDGRAGTRGTAARVIDGAIAFRGFVDHNEEFGLVPRLVAAALKAHRPSRGFRPTPVVAWASSCHDGWRSDKPRRCPKSRHSASDYRRTKPTMSFTAFMVSAAIACARAAPAARTAS